MLTNYLKVAFRNLLRHKGYTLINLFGLAVGISCSFIIVLFVQDELKYDRYNLGAANTYRLIWDVPNSGGNQSLISPLVMTPRISRWIPEIRQVTAIKKVDDVAISFADESFKEAGFFLADSSVFDVFTFTFLQGNRQSALTHPNAAVITSSTSRRYFGDSNPIGKTLNVSGYGLFEITGLIADLPVQSHFHPNVLASLSSVGAITNPWLLQGYIYLQLHEKTTPAEVEKKLTDYSDYTHFGWWVSGLKFKLQPLTKIHLHSHLQGEIEANGDIQYIYIYSTIALFVLLIASANYMNLALARSVQRAREVGIRKVLGGQRSHLALQFIGESVLLCLLAMPLALLCAEALLPIFNELVQKKLEFDVSHNSVLIMSCLGISLLVGVVSGAYPAFFLSSFQPVEVLQSSWKSPTGGFNLRKILVVLQFSIAIFLIIGALLIHDQLSFLRAKQLGFQRENIVVIPFGQKEMRDKYDLFRSELLLNPSIQKVAAASGSPIDGAALTDRIEDKNLQIFMIDPDYVPLMQMEMIAGRNFSYEYASDTNACIVNQAAAIALGWKDPIHQSFRGFGGGTVIGVVRDFHNKPLRQPIDPLVFEFNRHYFREMMVKIKPENAAETMSFIKSKWRFLAHDIPFQFSFLDEDYDRLYRTEERLEKMCSLFSILAILIACLGLYGLAAFVTERSTKEIGIRRVLGASVANVVLMLTKEFAKLVVLANLVAWPIAYYVMRSWLQDFAYRIEIGIGTFLLAGTTAFVIALAAVSYNAVRAALSDPVKALRYE